MKNIKLLIEFFFMLFLVIAVMACNKESNSINKVNNISIKKLPLKLRYDFGENLDLSGLVVTLEKDNGIMEDIELINFESNGLSCFPAHNSILKETKIIRVKYRDGNTEKETLFTTNVSVLDIEMNEYPVVEIGTQVWMGQNLKTTSYNNGDIIPTTSTPDADISKESTPKYQWAYDGNENNINEYGRLYTWHAATDTRGLCPTGWHLPSNDEWQILINYLGGYDEAGGKMKEIGETWAAPNVGATNESRFSALPGGLRQGTGFYTIGLTGSWWTSSEDLSKEMGKYQYMGYDFDGIYGNIYNKADGNSIRCIMD